MGVTASCLPRSFSPYTSLPSYCCSSFPSLSGPLLCLSPPFCCMRTSLALLQPSVPIAHPPGIRHFLAVQRCLLCPAGTIRNKLFPVLIQTDNCSPPSSPLSLCWEVFSLTGSLAHSQPDLQASRCPAHLHPCGVCQASRSRLTSVRMGNPLHAREMQQELRQRLPSLLLQSLPFHQLPPPNCHPALRWVVGWHREVCRGGRTLSAAPFPCVPLQTLNCGPDGKARIASSCGWTGQRPHICKDQPQPSAVSPQTPEHGLSHLPALHPSQHQRAFPALIVSYASSRHSSSATFLKTVQLHKFFFNGCYCFIYRFAHKHACQIPTDLFVYLCHQTRGACRI